MKIKIYLIILLSFIGALSMAEEWQPGPGFTSLFNGKDLSGWCFRDRGKESPTKGQIIAVFDGKAESNDKGRYSAEDGILTVNYPEGVKRLISRLDTVEEFAGSRLRCWISHRSRFEPVRGL